MTSLKETLACLGQEHVVTLEWLRGQQASLENSFLRLGELRSLTTLPQLQALRPKGGLAPELLNKSVVVAPAIVVTDERVRTLCQLPYEHPDGRNIGCGGIRHDRSACPPYAPTAEKTRRGLENSQAVLLVQAAGLREYEDQKKLHRTLLALEDHLAGNNFTITGSWAAGPCRACEPEDCLGGGKCRQPKIRRFSMEGSGMFVFETCDRVALITNDATWNLVLLKDWERPGQSAETFKSVIALGVS